MSSATERAGAGTARRVAAAAALMLAVLLGMSRPGAAAEMSAHEKALYEAAKGEGGAVTWYIAHFATDVAEALGKAFGEKYPGVEANVVRTTAQVAFQRLSADMKAGIDVCDVFSSTDTGHYHFLKSKGLLLPYTPENVAKLPKAFQGLDPDGTYHVTAVGLVLITYNKDKVKPEDLPKNWTDLLDPKWKDKVSTGHPGFSGYVGTWALLMRQLYGESFFTRLEKNRPQIGRSINDTVTMLVSGERTVAFGPDGTTANAIARGNPLGMIYPTDGALLMTSPSGIIKGTKRPNAAKLFEEFLLSEEASRVLVSFNNAPMRPEVAPPAGMRPISEVKVVRPSEAEIEKGIPAVKELWRDVFGS